jgi:stearoyl-CoA desaturase (delta-9 desaturase)
MDIDKTFEALASRPRRQILAHLSELELTTSELAERVGMSAPIRNLSGRRTAEARVATARGRGQGEKMSPLPDSLEGHRVRSLPQRSVVDGQVRFSPRKSLWFLGMASAATIGGWLTFSPAAFALFVVSTAIVLLFGHSLGSHRKLIHDSFQCPRWLEYTLVYLGVQVGLAGPLGLLRQHELRDYAQRLPDCHDYLRHGRGFWRDAWWQLHCELRLTRPPVFRLEPRLRRDRFYVRLEQTWMWQQAPWVILFFLMGGVSWVVWGVCVRVAVCVTGHWLVGHFAHREGEQT